MMEEKILIYQEDGDVINKRSEQVKYERIIRYTGLLGMIIPLLLAPTFLFSFLIVFVVFLFPLFLLSFVSFIFATPISKRPLMLKFFLMVNVINLFLQGFSLLGHIFGVIDFGSGFKM